MESKELADLCVKVAEDKKAKDPVIIALGEKSIIADYFVILTVNNDRHSRAVCNVIVDEVKKIKRKTLHREGVGTGGWMVLDLGVVIVHIFLDHIRKKYDLEDLWKECQFILDRRGVDECS